MKHMTLLLTLIALTLLSACSTVGGDYYEDSDNDDSFFDTNIHSSQNTNEHNINEKIANNPNNMIHQSVSKLANSLFSNANSIDLSHSVAIGTFLPIQLSNSPNLAEQNYIGLQIQESFITLAAQAGLNIIEFKTASAIKVTNNADLMLSRNTKELQRDVDAQYFLTGTYSEHNNQLMVNARIIELSTQRVIAAATDYMAMPSLNNQNKIIMKNNMLHRQAF